MTYLGYFSKGLSSLGQMAKEGLGNLGKFQTTLKQGIHKVSGWAGAAGNAISNNADKLDGVGLGDAARYAGNTLQSSSALGHSIGNFVGSRSIKEAVNNGVDVVGKGLKFGSTAMGYSRPPSSPLTK